MVESDEENYVTFGTPLDPLDEDNLPRKKPITIKDQYATDEQGRRRFHGAFTGGFSAGYFNTVGTRDGWRPQQFKSSRSSKAQNKTQKPQDFMDDEDVGEFGIAPTAIQASTDYTSHESKGTKRERSKYAGDGPIPGTPVLQELLKPVKDTVGVKLLKKMGWKPGQGVGPRLSKKEKVRIKQQNYKTRMYGCPLPPDQEELMETGSVESDDEDSNITFAPDDYEPYRCNPKDNFFGIGYSGLDKRPILSQHVNLFEPSTFRLQEKNKKLSIRGQAFGVGSFEAEDEDIYSKDDMSQYDFSLEPKIKQKSRWSVEKPSKSQRKCIEGFVPAKNPLESRKFFKPPELPPDFKPVHTVRKSRFEPQIESTSLEKARRGGLARHDLRAEDRARIINDPNPITIILSNKSSIESKNSAKPEKILGDNCLFPCVVDEEQVQAGTNVGEIINGSDEQQTSKKPSVISNIITKTLNLHGKEQAARNIEQSTRNLKSTKNSWLEQLNAKSFVKGGVENLSLNKEANVVEQSSTASSESISNLPNEIMDKAPEETSDKIESSTFKPFIANPDKQKRYEQFLVFSKSGEKSKLANIQPLSMLEWERDHERVEFEQAARLYKPLSGSMGDRFISGKQQDDLNPLHVVEKTKDADSQLREAAVKKLFGKLTRQRIDWQPASILCKRFNIAEPKTGCIKQETEKKTKFSVFDYLEESVHNSSTFQSATDIAVELKSEKFNDTSNKEGLRKELPDSCRSSHIKKTNNSAMLDCDNIDREKLSEKERNFEAKYERIFGKNVNALDKTEKDNISNILLDVKNNKNCTGGASHDKKIIDNDVELLESDQGRNRPEPSRSTTNNLINENTEKKDLFKAIFLSSSEDSDSDKEEELDDEKLKSVLIGKSPCELNVQRNTSPPRGIFANLDLDSLNDVSVKNVKISSNETENSTSINLEAGETSKTVDHNRSNNSSMGKKIENAKDSKDSTEIESENDLQILPDMYGPVLPSKPAKNTKPTTSDMSHQTQTQKHVFKSIVVPVAKPVTTLVEGEWIEKKKDKKLKKEKKKHKHKEHKKHKHKKHKR